MWTNTGVLRKSRIMTAEVHLHHLWFRTYNYRPLILVAHSAHQLRMGCKCRLLKKMILPNHIFHASCNNSTQGNKITWWTKLIFHHKWSFVSSAIYTQLSWNKELTTILVNYRICNKDCVPPLTVVLTNLSVRIYVFIMLYLTIPSIAQYHCFSLGQTRLLTSHLQKLSQRLVHLQRLPGGYSRTGWAGNTRSTGSPYVDKASYSSPISPTLRVYTWKFTICGLSKKFMQWVNGGVGCELVAHPSSSLHSTGPSW
jgi:hypothetical protein